MGGSGGGGGGHWLAPNIDLVGLSSVISTLHNHDVVTQLCTAVAGVG